ncbi:F0F1 ATP synthase subunit alpha [Patescibacteria group bacterium]|nr:F0F1 ATP synthase subunit alpha [Patescibacteria group bacterium]
MSYEIIEKLKKALGEYENRAEWQDIGRVIEIGDGVSRISGLENVKSQEIVLIETEKGEVPALALNLEEEAIGALILGNDSGIKSGDKVKRTGQILSIEVGEEMLGRVVDPLGKPLDGRGEIFKNKKPERYFLERKAPSVVDRESVKTPLHTGIKAIDAMIPIGRGQRELIIGDRQTGKTAIALDAIINQGQDKGRKPPVCIYVAIGQKESKVAKLIKTLEENGALKYSIVVTAGASSPAAFWYLAPYAGCAIGEYFMDKGEDALVVYDDLSKHAWGYRQISLLLRRPPGREAYPGDVFYLHSRLLERAAKLSKEKGSGSLTALPIIETQLGDISAYIPTNVISITDGQIYLESDLFYQGVKPAINAGLSVSRVGSSAQTKAMKKVAGRLRLELAQFRELQAFVQFASEVDEATKKRIKRGEILTEVLKQDDLKPVPFEEEVVLIYASINGYFDDLKKEEVRKSMNDLSKYFREIHPEILEKISSTGDLDGQTEELLKKSLDSWHL